MEGLVREGLDIVQALRINAAFADADALKKEYDDWDWRTRSAPGALRPAEWTPEERADIARMMATWNRQPTAVS